ncbi:hypothetical protein PR048_027269 [Dryococelus australis]|uniref:HTH CENPB-type domain-containing protein n=1 Tax=Dryococelus australis TaxID=614101 RepID=A0ABQ9GF00_9NEOP|nr:hypothetical protein PR048_027269 [Dryococelus australis]
MHQKADYVALRLEICDFTFSNGWLQRFKEHKYLFSKSVCGESVAVDVGTAESWLDICQTILFNMDETGIFYNLLPNKTLAIKNIKRLPCDLDKNTSAWATTKIFQA